MLKWPECDKRSVWSHPHRYSLWSVSWALVWFLNKIEVGFSEVCVHAYKAIYGILLNKACVGCCCFLRKKEQRRLKLQISRLIQKGTCYGGLKFSVTKLLPVKKGGSTIPGQAELLMCNALGQDQQKLCTGWEVPDEDFGPWVVRKSSLGPGWNTYYLPLQQQCLGRSVSAPSCCLN